MQGQAELVAVVGLHRATVQTLQHRLCTDLVEVLDFKSLNRKQRRVGKRGVGRGVVLEEENEKVED